MRVDRAAVEAFRRDGYVVVDGLLGDDELDRLAPAVSDAVARRKAADTQALKEKSRYEQSFLQCQNLWEDDVDVRPLTFHPRPGEVAAALLGADGVRLWHEPHRSGAAGPHGRLLRRRLHPRLGRAPPVRRPGGDPGRRAHPRRRDAGGVAATQK